MTDVVTIVMADATVITIHFIDDDIYIISYTTIESAIVDYAKRNHVDLIVIGTTGHSGFKKLMPGGVASGVIKHSHCPVMMIK
jgi:nucleotide-binding universal stress UspA family protein